MREEAVALCHHGRTVRGVYRRPEGEGPFPAVLLSHGYNGCMTDFDATAAYLASRGVASLAYTFCGGSARDESGFPTSSMTLMTEREDALALLDWLRARPETDEARAFFFGASMGGLVSVLAVRERPAEVAGLALLYPALCVPDDWRARFPDEAAIPETLDFWGMTLGRAFFTTQRELDVYALMGEIACRTLILHGDRDEIVPLACSRRAARLLPDATLRVFPGEGHGFSPMGTARVAAMLATFALGCD